MYITFSLDDECGLGFSIFSPQAEFGFSYFASPHWATHYDRLEKFYYFKDGAWCLFRNFDWYPPPKRYMAHWSGDRGGYRFVSITCFHFKITHRPVQSYEPIYLEPPLFGGHRAGHNRCVKYDNLWIRKNYRYLV